MNILENINYPVYIIFYGAERDYRTKYRSEHPGYFNSGMVSNIKEAENFIKSARERYYGTDRDSRIIIIHLQDNELVETEL